MVQPISSLNQVPAEPELKDLLDLHKKDVMLSLSSMHIGTIESFTALKQTATISINYLRTYFEKDVSGNYVAVNKSYPLLVDVPVVFLGGNQAALTMPVTKGDECLVFFNDKAIDGWFVGSSNSALPSNRLHSMADGIALVGVRSLAKVLTGFDGSKAVLRNGVNSRVAVGADYVDVEYGVGPSKVTLRVQSSGVTGTIGSTVTFEVTTAGKLNFTSGGISFMQVLVDLFTSVQGATAGGYPLVMPSFAAQLTQLTGFKP